MARRVVFIDDLDQSHGAHPVRFGFRDKLYEIDLSDDHEAEFEQLLSRYIEASTEVTAPPAVTGRRRGAPKRASRDDLAAIREWAKQQGIKVSDRGRIKADIIEQYDREHGTS